MDNNVNKQHCCARNNGRALLGIWHGDIKGIWNELVGRGLEIGRVGRVRVFEELPAVFNCSVLTFGVQ
jgi:hypothetical protein